MGIEAQDIMESIRSASQIIWMANFIKLAIFRYISKHSKTLAFS